MKSLGWILIPPAIIALSLVGFVDFAVELPPNAYPLPVWFVTFYVLGVLVFSMEYLTRNRRIK